MIILVLGEPQLSSRIGRVVEGSAAERAGFRSGDTILEMDGKAVTKFEEVMTTISQNPGKTFEFKVRGASDTAPHRTLSAQAYPQDGFSVYGEATHVGEIDGLLANARGPILGVSDPKSKAGLAGLKTGERIKTVNGVALESWEILEAQYQEAKMGTLFEFDILASPTAKDETKRTVRFKKEVAAGTLDSEWGLFSSEIFIQKTIADSPAEKAGLKSGDRILRVGDTSIHSFFELRDAVQRAGEKDGRLTLRWEREGKPFTAEIVPNGAEIRDPVMRKTKQFTIGVMPIVSYAEPHMIIERELNPFYLVSKATQRMIVLSWRNFVSIQKMFTGDVSVGALGGPIMIGKLAGESLSRGVISFLSLMAILSVGLGVLNLLPIPVLDGGHLLLLGIESVRGRPLTGKQMEWIQGIGLSFILILMVIVMHNDILRLPFLN